MFGKHIKLSKTGTNKCALFQDGTETFNDLTICFFGIVQDLFLVLSMQMTFCF